MKMFLAFALLVLPPRMALRQKRAGENRITINVGLRSYQNERNITPGLGNPISTKNTTGVDGAIGYERRTAYGLLLGHDVQYGVHSNPIYMRIDLSNYDPEATKSLQGQIWEEDYSQRLKYVNNRFTVGYERRVSKRYGTAVQVKLSYAIRSYLNGDYLNGTGRLLYSLDSSNTMRSVAFVGVNYHLGTPEDRSFFSRGHSGSTTYEIYIGVVHPLKTKFLKSMTLGVEYTRCVYKTWTTNGPSGAVWLYVSSNTRIGGPFVKHYYLNQNESFAVKLGLNLWR